MNEMPSNPMPTPEDDLKAEYWFDYQKAKPNRLATSNNLEKLKVVVSDDSCLTNMNRISRRIEICELDAF